MQTIVKSPTQTVIIGPDQPFVIIGERINPTGRKLLAGEMQAGDFSRVVRDAKAQVEAGAHILDVNAGVPSAEPSKTEPELMVKAVQAVQSVTDVPLCIDSSVPAALIAGLKAAGGRPIVNSVTGEEERLAAILPVVAEYGVPVIGLCHDEEGISYDVEKRFAAAVKIVERAASYGIPREDILIDPLAMPVSAVNTAGLDLLRLVQKVHAELGCNTVCGASNISFGLPNRNLINTAFVPMAIAAGLTSAITNPLEESIRQAIYAADVLMGRDEMCMRYVMAMRRAQSGGEEPPRRRTMRPAS
jgi:5-methyltetrahydrofolate--homocysteine methyltransferase